MMERKEQTISVVITVKDEEKIIEECLKGLKWVDEIIIINNGCTDNTIPICKKYKARIYTHNKKELIPFLQNIGIQKATKEWIIIIDADVRIPEKTKEEIIEKINDDTCDGYYLKHQVYFLNKPLSSPYFGEHNILKLFRRGTAYFNGEYAHESVVFKGRRVGYIKNKLIHLAHPQVGYFVRKMNKYTTEDAYKHAKKKKIGFFGSFIIPLISLPHYFFLRLGFLNGLRGFIYCHLLSMYLLLERIKMFEIQEMHKIDKHSSNSDNHEE